MGAVVRRLGYDFKCWAVAYPEYNSILWAYITEAANALQTSNITRLREVWSCHHNVRRMSALPGQTAVYVFLLSEWLAHQGHSSGVAAGRAQAFHQGRRYRIEAEHEDGRDGSGRRLGGQRHRSTRQTPNDLRNSSTDSAKEPQRGSQRGVNRGISGSEVAHRSEMSRNP
jgi:hypothetical protein